MGEKGFIVIDRCVREWQWFGVSNAMNLWFYILLNAQWKDSHFLGHEVPRGSLWTSVARISAETDMSEKTIRNWLKKFEDAGQITVKGANKGTLISVVNYAKYQDRTDGKGKQITEQVTEQTTEQVTEQVTNIRTKKQRNKETNIERFVKPTLEQVQKYITEKGFEVDAQRFMDYYDSNGWKVGRNPMKSWEKTVNNWARNEKPKKTMPDYLTSRSDEKASEEDLENVRRMLQQHLGGGE